MSDPAPAPPLVVIAGPTAAGKSALAMALAEAAGGELVSADSVQIYRGLDIGSAKPSAAERARVPHHCLDILAPTEQADAGRWREAADAAIADIGGRGRLPIVCGGTGLYIKALLYGLAPIPDVPEIRDEVARELAERGPEALHRALAEVDPQGAARLAPADRQRVGRALEVARATGRPLSAWQAEHRFADRRYAAVTVCLWPDREALYSRIDIRARQMIRAGLVGEVAALLADGVPADAPGLSTLGYREVVAHLAGEIDAETLPLRVARGHRHYAKRQLTWFRRLLADDAEAHHLDPRDPLALERIRAWANG